MILALIILTSLVLVVLIFIQMPPFGGKIKGKSLKKIQDSPHFNKGKFQNLHITPSLEEGATYFQVLKEFLFHRSPRSRPRAVLPSKKTNLLEIPTQDNVMVWFGHSSYFLQVDTKKILVDPVFSGSASPVKVTTRSFKGTDIYTAEEMPDIDLLILSHDHWDHLDYDTVTLLKHKIKRIITGLGVGTHLERWGFNAKIIEEMDWFQSIRMEDGFMIHALPARHFSGRSFKRDGSLWMSYALCTPSSRIYIGGDSGYDDHFGAIGKQYGPFDLAILENGQYNHYWKYIHMMPEEVVKAAMDLRAKKLIPVHWAKFALGLHAWDEPIKRIVQEAEKKKVNLIHPMIGERIDLNKENNFTKWWENMA